MPDAGSSRSFRRGDGSMGAVRQHGTERVRPPEWCRTLARRARRRLPPDGRLGSYWGDFRKLNAAPAGSVTWASRPYGVSSAGMRTVPPSFVTVAIEASTSSTSQ
jgi:hypothetical protein